MINYLERNTESYKDMQKNHPNLDIILEQTIKKSQNCKINTFLRIHLNVNYLSCYVKLLLRNYLKLWTNYYPLTLTWLVGKVNPSLKARSPVGASRRNPDTNSRFSRSSETSESTWSSVGGCSERVLTEMLLLLLRRRRGGRPTEALAMLSRSE